MKTNKKDHKKLHIFIIERVALNLCEKNWLKIRLLVALSKKKKKMEFIQILFLFVVKDLKSIFNFFFLKFFQITASWKFNIEAIFISYSLIFSPNFTRISQSTIFNPYFPISREKQWLRNARFRRDLLTNPNPRLPLEAPARREQLRYLLEVLRWNFALRHFLSRI